MKRYTLPVIRILAMLLRDRSLDDGTGDFNHIIGNLVDMIQDGVAQSRIIQQIHAVLLQMWTTTWHRASWKPNLIADPTEAGLALLTLNQDGAFKEPKEVTQIIAKLEYCMRLTFLKEIRARTDMDKDITEATACDTLQPWFTEKTYSTFSRLRSLQHRASAISYETMGLPHIWWTDTAAWMSLKYNGNPISFSSLCTMFQDVENDLVSTWENNILRKLTLRADYHDLVDDPSNKDVGYSFLFDPKNTCLQDRTRLVRAVVEGQGGFSGFLLQQDGELIWNRAALRGWLQDYAELQKLLLLRAEMLSGAPARGTELTAAIYCNTQTRPTRNLMVFGQHVTLLCQYSKMTALTGHDKLIPHSLDAITSDILIQDLALARPFAQLAAKICFEDENIVQLYRELLFVNFNRKFTSEDLSAVMSKYSLPRIHYALTINPWRHIQTAWKRKLKCAVEHIVEMDEGEDVEALQAGHTRATENRIYGLSTQSLAGAAEDILPLFLQASASWQEHCNVPSGGQSIPYYQARESMHAKLQKEPASMQNLAHNRATANKPSGESPTTCPTTSKPITEDDIVNKVVERLTPMLTEIMQAIERQVDRQSKAPASSPQRLSSKQQGKQRQAYSENAYEVANEKNKSINEHSEDAELQAAIRASMVAPGKPSSSLSLSSPTNYCIQQL